MLAACPPRVHMTLLWVPPLMLSGWVSLECLLGVGPLMKWHPNQGGSGACLCDPCFLGQEPVLCCDPVQDLWFRRWMTNKSQCLSEAFYHAVNTDLSHQDLIILGLVW